MRKRDKQSYPYLFLHSRAKKQTRANLSLIFYFLLCFPMSYSTLRGLGHSLILGDLPLTPVLCSKLPVVQSAEAELAQGSRSSM